MVNASIHPRAVRWTPTAAPRNGVGRSTGSECHLGYTYLTTAGWQATCHPHWDVGIHKTEAAAKQAVERGYEDYLRHPLPPRSITRSDGP